MLIVDLSAAGLFVPYERMRAAEVEETKLRLLDALLAIVGGAAATGEQGIGAVRQVVSGAGGVRPVYPHNGRVSLEAAAFLNGYLLRQADWGDSYWVRGVLKGHPSDQLAAVLALADDPGVAGRQVLELVYLAYQLWGAIYAAMPDLQDSGWDYTTILALTVPVLAGVRFNASLEQINGAVRLSASGGMIAGQVRAGDITNWKSGATAYALARALWSYRLSSVFNAPPSMFQGHRGWNCLVAPIREPLVPPPAEDLPVYANLDVKVYPCFQIAQAAVACAARLHPALEGRGAQVDTVLVRLGERNAQVANRPERSGYPTTHSAADHHVGYCVATTLLHGVLTPLHYEQQYLQSPAIRALTERTTVQSFSAGNEPEGAGGAEGCVVEITLRNGERLRHAVTRPAGAFRGLSTDDRLTTLRQVLAEKRRMAEIAGGSSLAGVANVIETLETRSGADLIQSLHDAWRRGK